jgi:riboflavin kinase / FMN adenylyltransferase
VQAEKFLGKHYAIAGRVIHGEKRGRLLGFPTANIAINDILAVLSGVYVVQVEGLEAGCRVGVANIGRRPTVGGNQRLLEVHLLDFTGDIYGRKINVQFLHKLRDEQKFASIEHLREQIAKDKKQAHDYFEERVIPT